MAFSNLQKVLGQLQRYGQDFYDGAAAAQVDAAELVLERAKFYTPVDTGLLKGTGRVDIELRELSRASARIVFDAPYSVFVHERMDLQHKSPTQAKFLKRAVDELAPKMTTLIGEGAVSAAKAEAAVNKWFRYAMATALLGLAMKALPSTGPDDEDWELLAAVQRWLDHRQQCLRRERHV